MNRWTNGAGTSRRLGVPRFQPRPHARTSPAPPPADLSPLMPPSSVRSLTGVRRADPTRRRGLLSRPQRHTHAQPLLLVVETSRRERREENESEGRRGGARAVTTPATSGCKRLNEFENKDNPKKRLPILPPSPVVLNLWLKELFSKESMIVVRK